MWYEMTLLNGSENSGLHADVHIPSTSAWFDGHFPGQPLLPGIAQIGMVLDLIRQGTHQPVSLVEIRRVRYKKMILPEDRIRIEAVPKAEKDGEYTFRIIKDKELVASGNLIVGRPMASTAEIH